MKRPIHGSVSAASRSILRTRARLISAAMFAISSAITAAMSLAFYVEVRAAMLVTSLVCAVVIDRFALDYLVEIGVEVPPEAAAMLADAGEATSSIEVILRDLTSLARPADEPVVPTDLTAAIDTAVRLASYRLGAGVKLERAPIVVPRVHANGSRLVQVFLNLIINAARASRAGRTNHIRIAAETRGERVALSIADPARSTSAPPSRSGCRPPDLVYA